MNQKNQQPSVETIEQTDAETNAIYKITDNPETPAEVKKYLLDYLFEKNGISVEFSEVETGQNENGEIDAPQGEQIGMDKIRLTPIQAVELSQLIITQTTGIFSADAQDDEPKQALLVLLSAIVYEEDMTQRENILFDVIKAVFNFSYAADKSADQFIRNGFQSFSNGNRQVPAASRDVTKNEPLKDLANQLSEVMKNPNLPTHLYNAMSDELAIVNDGTDAPENILLNLESHLKKNR